jgi:transcriptional regulator with XRE-family HTH domain
MVHALGRALGAYRKANGMSLQALSDRVGVATSILGKLELGKAYPSIGTLRDLAKFLGWSPEETGEFVFTSTPVKPGSKPLRQKFLAAQREAMAATG